MKKNNFNRVGSEAQYDPRTIEEIVKDFLEHSNSPFAVAYRQQKARQKATRTEGLHPNTMMGVNLKTLLLHDTVVKLDKDYRGVLHRDVECDEFLYDEHYTFIETAPQKAVKRNPQVFDGHYITITRWADGSLHPHLKHIDIGDGFDVIGYATAVGNELLWALESLIEKLHKKNRP